MTNDGLRNKYFDELVREEMEVLRDITFRTEYPGTWKLTWRDKLRLWWRTFTLRGSR